MDNKVQNADTRILDQLRTEGIVSLNSLVGLEKKNINGKDVLVIQINPDEFKNLMVSIGSDTMLNLKQDDVITFTKHHDTLNMITVFRNQEAVFIKEITRQFVLINVRKRPDGSDIILFDIVDAIPAILEGDYECIKHYPLFEKEIKTIIRSGRRFKSASLYVRLSPLSPRLNILNTLYEGIVDDSILISDLSKYDDAVGAILPYLINPDENKYIYVNDILYSIASYNEGKMVLNRISNGSEMVVSLNYIMNAAIANVISTKTVLIDRCGDVYKDGKKLDKTIYSYMPLINEKMTDESNISKLYTLVNEIEFSYNNMKSGENSSIEALNTALDKIAEYRGLYNSIAHHIDTKLADDEFLFVDLCKNKPLISKPMFEQTYKNVDIVEEEIKLQLDASMAGYQDPAMEGTDAAEIISKDVEVEEIK
jgi:hypothetical protein